MVHLDNLLFPLDHEKGKGKRGRPTHPHLAVNQHLEQHFHFLTEVLWNILQPFLRVPTIRGPDILQQVQSKALLWFLESPTGKIPETTMSMYQVIGNSHIYLVMDARTLVVRRGEVDETPLTPRAFCCVQHCCDSNFLQNMSSVQVRPQALNQIKTCKNLTFRAEAASPMKSPGST